SHLRSEATVGLGLVLLISMAATAWRRRMPYWFVGWFWFLIALVPMLGIVAQVGTQAHADRYTYIPSIGLAIAIAWSVAELWSTQWMGGRALAVPAIAALLVLAVMTGIQSRYWHDSESLWGHALDINDKNYFAHFSMGLALRHERKLEAIEHYKR